MGRCLNFGAAQQESGVNQDWSFSIQCATLVTRIRGASRVKSHLESGTIEFEQEGCLQEGMATLASFPRRFACEVVCALCVIERAE